MRWRTSEWRTLSQGFKREAVKLLGNLGLTVAQASRDLDMHETVLRKWRGSGKQVGPALTLGAVVSGSMFSENESRHPHLELGQDPRL